MDSRYWLWALERLAKRFTAYIVILPVITILYPITTLGYWLGKTYYRLRG